MQTTHLKHLTYILSSLVLVVVLGGLCVLLWASSGSPVAKAGSDDNMYGYAWSSNIGWISMNSANCDADNNGYVDAGFPGVWGTIGASLSISGIGHAALAALSSSRVAFIDESNEDLRTYEFNGSTWSQVGSDLPISSTGDPALAALSSSRVAFIDGTNDDLRTYEFNGSTWSQVGSELNISGVDKPALAALSSSRIVFIDSGNDDLRVYEFNGSTWSQVGSDLALSGVGHPALAALSSSRVAFIDESNEDLRTYEFNGSTWSQVGSDLPISSTGDPALAALSSERVMLIDSTSDDLRVFDFNGSTWAQTGTEYVLSGVDTPALTTLSEYQVVFIDEVNEDMSVYTFDSGCPSSGTTIEQYGVALDEDTGFFSGYAWSPNIGWIDFAPGSGYPSTPNQDAQQIGSDIIGWVKAVSGGSAESGGWDGWIKMSGSWSDGVTVSGTDLSGFAWGSDVVGWVDFGGVTVALPGSLIFTADSILIASGTPVTLEWITTNMDSCTASDDWTGSKSVNGTYTEEVNPAVDSIYTIDCVDDLGQPHSDSIIVQVFNANAVSLTTDKQIVRQGESVVLSWDTGGIPVGNCTFTGPQVTPIASTTGSQTITMNSTNTFTLDCVAADASVVVNVVPALEEN